MQTLQDLIADCTKNLLGQSVLMAVEIIQRAKIHELQSKVNLMSLSVCIGSKTINNVITLAANHRIDLHRQSLFLFFSQACDFLSLKSILNKYTFTATSLFPGM